MARLAPGLPVCLVLGQEKKNDLEWLDRRPLALAETDSTAGLNGYRRIAYGLAKAATTHLVGHDTGREAAPSCGVEDVCAPWRTGRADAGRPCPLWSRDAMDHVVFQLLALHPEGGLQQVE